jgi:hypothetical protein
MTECQDEKKTISNKVDPELKGELDLAVAQSDYDQKDILEGMIETSLTEDDRGVPTVKSEVIENFEDLNGD